MRILLASRRESANMTQTQVSKYANISQGYYSEIESGFRCPSPSVAENIAKVLDINEKDMFRFFYSKE
jgi:transcriptional regulator with XRE-family HTH domain